VRKLYLIVALVCALGACGGGAETVVNSGSGTSNSGGPGGSGGTGTTNPGTPPPKPASPTDVLTFKNDVGRTGQNLTESVLTASNVNSTTFGLLRNLSVDGKVDAQPLYLSQLTIGGAVHNALFVATEGDSVYAFDSDTGATLWHVNLLLPGESLSDNRGCVQVEPNIGITSTPVIDRTAGPSGALYVVAMSKDPSSAYHQRLHALDVTTGAELFHGPVEITATYPATAGGTSSSFQPGQYVERAALLLSKGIVYTSWTSHCDIPPYSGWIMGYNQTTLAQTSVLNIGPNSSRGPAIWMAGSGPAADSAGNIYLLSANGAFETALDSNGFPSGQDFGNSFLKLSAGATTLAVADYFAMWNEVSESAADQDLGAGGEMLLPDLTDSTKTVRHLVVGAGKDGTIYVVDRDSMGKFNASSNNIWQQLTAALPGGVFSSPAYFNGTVYYADINGSLKAFPVTNAKLGTASPAQSAMQFPYPGSSPAVSANGTANGIVWAHENNDPAVLHAYDATNLARELYNSSQAPNNRDHFGAGNKFVTPAVADGKVFVGTQNSVAVFGLLQP
jgi:putative pyrroloquinoline-quinone-binding quinoprotein